MKKVAFLMLVVAGLVTLAGCCGGCCKKKECGSKCSESSCEKTTERVSGPKGWGLDEEELDVYKK